MQSVLMLVYYALDFLKFIVIAQVILSWLISFGVVNTNNQFVSTIYRMTHQITEPLSKPIRRFIPSFGGLDLSPIIIFLGIYFLQDLILRYGMPMLANAGL
ncbi:YggT family protein [Hirschia litorea]|uniref:YggT family protein n=1 Tax=Hirschia litorea TaxID=1199156 RepID=A0ABW2IP14_9PROT